MTFTHALPSGNYGTAKFIVSANVWEGTHTTIAAALTAAVSGETIFVRTGTYTENLTMKAGVNIVSYETEGLTPTVTIVGKITASFSGTASIGGIRLQTSSDNCLSVTGASTQLNLTDCYIIATNNSAISQSNGIIKFLRCNGDITTTGIALFAMTGGVSSYQFCFFDNSGASSTQNSNANGGLLFFSTTINNPIIVSGTGSINALGSTFATPSGITLTQNSTAVTEMNVRNCFFISPTTSAISIGAGAQLTVDNSVVRGGSVNGITGAGTVRAGDIVFEDAATTINTATIITLASFPLRGKVIQQVRQQVTGLATTTATIPSDTSIPQNTEGTEFTTLAITPIYANSTLVIEFNANVGMSTAEDLATVALFQDSNVNALETRGSSVTNGRFQVLGISYEMLSGTTSSTTFKIRYGTSNAANAANINGTAGVNYFGASNMTYFTITEFQT